MVDSSIRTDGSSELAHPLALGPRLAPGETSSTGVPQAPHVADASFASPRTPAETPGPAGTLEVLSASSPTQTNLLLSIPPPKPYDLLIDHLTIGLPPSKRSRLSRLRPGKEKGELGGEESILGSKTIVRDVVGRCNAGEVLAILGGSGSGKSTLLNCIASRLGGLPILKGDVSFLPVPGRDEQQGEKDSDRVGAAGSKEIGRVLGFVRQSDSLLPYLTVRETLSFAAALRLPRSVSKETQAAIVEQTITELGLQDVRDTVVGGALRKGLSGGERRRLSIGCVLTLSTLAKRNRTIICSLHSPRSDTFAILDRVIVLSKGDVVYSGPTSESLSWFSELGSEVPTATNPLDFLIDISSIDNRDPDREEESRARVSKLVTSWRSSPRFTAQLSRSGGLKDSTTLAATGLQSPPISLTRTRTQGSGMLDVDEEQDRRRPGLAAQTRVLLKRSHLNVYRNYAQTVGFLVQAIIIGLLAGFTYFQLGGTPQDIQSIKNASFQIVPAYFYLCQVYWIFVYCQSLLIFDREHEDRLYNALPYVVAEFISVLLPSVLAPLLYVVIFYVMADLRSDPYASSLFTIVSTCVLVQWCTQGLALLAASITRSFALASVICNALSLFQLLSSGFVLVVVPPWVKWVRWIAPQFFAFRINAPTLLKDRTFSCEGVTGITLTQCNGNNVLRGLAIDPATSVGWYFIGLAGLAVVLHVLATFLLHFYHPGGVRFAGRVGAERSGKESTVVGELDMPRARIDVEVSHLSLRWMRRSCRPWFGAADKTILNDVSATFPAGQVSAIIGPSGAGKSSILQMLANLKMGPGPMAKFDVQGQILFNGAPLTKEVQSSIAFVEQHDDYHLSGLTVRETLKYAAVLRLPESMSRKKKEARAEEVLLLLGLKDCAETLVGSELVKGISGGEKRRLSLAVQMINDPSILVVDEPTSGLDAFIAQNVMTSLTEIAKSGRTVIATIHQPRSDIVSGFDNVVVLAKGGSVVFSGPNEHALPWFEAHGHPLPSPHFNPADHILDVISIDPVDPSTSKERVSTLIERWSQQVSKKELADDKEAEGAARRDHVVVPASSLTSFRTAGPVVLHRQVLNLWRQKDAFFNRLTQAPLLAVLFLLFYTRLTRGPSGAQDRIGITIENTTALPFVGLLNGIAVFPQEIALYLHEYKSSAAYSAATFVTAYTLFDLSMSLLASFLYALVMHVAVGMQTSVRIYFEFSFTIWAFVSFGESIAMIFSTFASDAGLAVSLVSTCLAVISQISGIVSLSVPSWLRGISWATPLASGTRVQIINELRGLTFICDAASIQSGTCVATSGDQLLSNLGFYDLNTSKFMGILVASAVGWRLLAWVCIAIRVRQA